MNRLKKGFTIVELLVVVAIIALLIAILLPAIGKAREAALVTQSMGNLRNLVVANASYGADYGDRQFTAVPDEMGQYGQGWIGACGAYVAKICIPQQILGWDNAGGLWGYWIAGSASRCAGWPGNCGNFTTYIAANYGAADFFGAWRMPNVKAFNTYVNGKYYDPVFWAPKDRFTLENIQQYFSQPVEFNYVNNNIEFPTYCWSPAAMWASDVLSRTNAGCTVKEPGINTLPGGFKSPACGVCTYPSLKTRMLEHQWLQNTEGASTNPAFGTPTPWYFNQGYNSAPATMFFDGHVQMMSVNAVQSGNDLIKGQLAGSQATNPQCGLWLTAVNGGNGYYQQAAYDMLCAGVNGTSFHVLTADGILGRDAVQLGD